MRSAFAVLFVAVPTTMAFSCGGRQQGKSGGAGAQVESGGAGANGGRGAGRSAASRGGSGVSGGAGSSSGTASSSSSSGGFVSSIRVADVDKLDLLFMIDNSPSMGDKQVLLAQAVPDMITRLVTPNCVDSGGSIVGRSDMNGQCTTGTPEAVCSAEQQIDFTMNEPPAGSIATIQCSN